MINSDFDRVIRGENNYNTNNNKKGKLKIFIIVFCLVIAIAGIAFGYSYYSKYKTALPRIKFFEYIQKTNINEITDTSIIDGIISKMNESSYTLKNNISMVTEEQESLIGKLNFDVNYYRDNEKNINELDLALNNNKEKVSEISTIIDGENVGIKSEEIVIKYVGSKIKNIPSIIGGFYGLEENSNTQNQEKIEIPNSEIFDKYKMIISSKLTDEQFSMEKNVKLTQNNTSIEATLYKLAFTKEEVMQIITELQDTLINDDELIEYLISGQTDEEAEYEMGGISPDNIFNLIYGNKINVDPEEIKEEIENNYTAIYQELNKIENLNFEFEIYVNNSKVIKEVISLGNLLEINIDFEQKDENENSVKATILLTNQENKEKNGFSISLKRKNNNVTTNFNTEVCLIENMQINYKVILETSLEGNQNSTNVNYNSKVIYSDTESEYIAKINSKLEYSLNKKIEKLNSENCLFLDELDDSSFAEVVSAIINKTIETFNAKKDKILNNNDDEDNSSSQIVDMDGKTETEKKEEAKNKLIDEIRKQVEIAQNEDRVYTLMDLKELNIEDSTLSIMVNENLAIVAIDGFTFYIDPNFVLTEE